jgi:hypothetical protein
MAPGGTHRRRTRDPLSCIYPRCPTTVLQCQTMAASVTRMIGRIVPAGSAEPLDDDQVTAATGMNRPTSTSAGIWQQRESSCASAPARQATHHRAGPRRGPASSADHMAESLPAMVSLDAVVGIPLGDVHRRGNQLVQDPRISGARSVRTSAGIVPARSARVKNRRAAAKSRRADSGTSMTWPIARHR